jgi:hypothetical protein
MWYIFYYDTVRSLLMCACAQALVRDVKMSDLRHETWGRRTNCRYLCTECNGYPSSVIFWSSPFRFLVWKWVIFTSDLRYFSGPPCKFWNRPYIIMYIVLYYTITILYYTVLYCTLLSYTILFSFLYCTILYCNRSTTTTAAISIATTTTILLLQQQDIVTGWVVSTLASYSGSLGFKCWSGDRLS